MKRAHIFSHTGDSLNDATKHLKKTIIVSLQFLQIMNFTWYLLLFPLPASFCSRFTSTMYAFLSSSDTSLQCDLTACIHNNALSDESKYGRVIGFPISRKFWKTSTHFLYKRVTIYHCGSFFRLFSCTTSSIDDCKVNVAPDCSLRQWYERTFKPQ